MSEKKRPSDLDFMEWLNELIEPDGEVKLDPIHQRFVDFITGRSKEDVKLVLRQPGLTRTWQLIEARMLMKPWENRRVRAKQGDGFAQLWFDETVETYPSKEDEPCDDLERFTVEQPRLHSTPVYAAPHTGEVEWHDEDTVPISLAETKTELDDIKRRLDDIEAMTESKKLADWHRALHGDDDG